MKLDGLSCVSKPVGACDRCLDCAVEEKCPYSAKKIYLEPAERGYWGFPVHVVTDVKDIETLTNELRTGPYGKCAYDCDNDVCDNQVLTSRTLDHPISTL